MHVHGLCDWHQTAMQTKALEKDNWPASISRRTLSTRMKKLSTTLAQLAQTPSTSQVYQLAKLFWEKKGRAYATGSKGMWEASQEWGYS